MTTLDEALQGSDADWIGGLPKYQSDIIASLLEGKTPDEAATMWLSASGPANTFPFGATRGASLFFDKVVDEVEAFICRDNAYTEDKKKLLTQVDVTHAYTIGLISAAISHAVGAAAPYIAPAVALILVTSARIGRNAWCAMRQEQRTAQPPLLHEKHIVPLSL